MADTSLTRSGWVLRPIPPEPRSIAELIAAGTIDAELAATAWLLLEARVPLLVAGDGPGVGRSTLLRAMLDFLPSELRIVELRGVDETFDWLPQASELGWPGVPSQPAGTPFRPENTVILATELSDQTPASTWGQAAQVAVRAAAIGYGLVATIHGDSLDDVLAGLRANPVRLTGDELSRLGVVLVVRRLSGDRRRVVAAHYLRPVARDVHGHVQRLGPAVLATWDPASDTFEAFGWGVTPELAMRVGRRAGDFEIELQTRRAFLDDLVARGITDVDSVREAIGRYRPRTAAELPSPPSPQPRHHSH
ncbi:MAG: hypothetical protein WEE50_03765 [Chloroflexota bacterium]